MHVWTERKIGLDGLQYDVRYLMTDQEAKQLQRAGLVGELWRVIDMQPAADGAMAMFERNRALASGGSMQ